MRQPDGGGGVSDGITKRQGDDIIALLQDLARGGIDVGDIGIQLDQTVGNQVEAIANAVEELTNIDTALDAIHDRLAEAHDHQVNVAALLSGICDNLASIDIRLEMEADDRAKQRRYMRFNLVQDIADWERRVVEDDDTLHAEGMLLRLREELEVLDDLWPDTAAVALVAMQR